VKVVEATYGHILECASLHHDEAAVLRLRRYLARRDGSGTTGFDFLPNDPGPKSIRLSPPRAMG